jgi:branched-chain amino acid transport system substrate-binding protein
LVADAIKRAGSTDPAAVTKALNATTAYPAVTGDIAFKNGSRVPSKPVAIMYVDHAKVNLKSTVTP